MPSDLNRKTGPQAPASNILDQRGSATSWRRTPKELQSASALRTPLTRKPCVGRRRSASISIASFEMTTTRPSSLVRSPFDPYLEKFEGKAFSRRSRRTTPAESVTILSAPARNTGPHTPPSSTRVRRGKAASVRCIRNSFQTTGSVHVLRTRKPRSGLQ